MQKFNKASAAVVAGAVATSLGVMFSLDPVLVGALGTVLTAAMVYFIPNQETS